MRFQTAVTLRYTDRTGMRTPRGASRATRNGAVPVAKKTPDYTKQARKRQATRKTPAQRAEEARRASAAKSAPADYSQKARQERRQKSQTPEPASRGMRMAVYMSLYGGMGLFCFGIYLAISMLGGTDPRALFLSLLGMVCGILCNIMVLLMSMFVLDPQGHPLPSVNKQYLMWGIVGTGLICVAIVMASKFWQLIMGPALIPPIAIMVFVLRPRLKAQAIAEGRYTKTRSEKAREDWERERAERKAAKEQWERLKRERLSEPAAATAGGKGGSRAKGSGKSSGAARNAGGKTTGSRGGSQAKQSGGGGSRKGTTVR